MRRNEVEWGDASDASRVEFNLRVYSGTRDKNTTDDRPTSVHSYISELYYVDLNVPRC